MPDLALLAFAGSLAAVAVLCALRRSALEAGFLWALVACFLALESDRSTSLYLATGGLILIVALLESTFAMAFRDPLTGLASRRAFDEAFEKLAAAYVIAMVDVDDFKAVNDRYGHDVGDQILRMVATRIEAAGSGVRAYRVGGEEFALVYANRSRDEVLVDLENLRAAIAESPFALRSPDRPARRPKRVRSPPGAGDEDRRDREYRRRRIVRPARPARPGAPGGGRGALQGQARGAQPRLRLTSRGPVAPGSGMLPLYAGPEVR